MYLIVINKKNIAAGTAAFSRFRPKRIPNRPLCFVFFFPLHSRNGICIVFQLWITVTAVVRARARFDLTCCTRDATAKRKGVKRSPAAGPWREINIETLKRRRRRLLFTALLPAAVACTAHRRRNNTLCAYWNLCAIRQNSRGKKKIEIVASDL